MAHVRANAFDLENNPNLMGCRANGVQQMHRAHADRPTRPGTWRTIRNRRKRGIRPLPNRKVP